MLIYILAFLAGFLVKVVDWFDDDKKSKHFIKYLLAIIYGVLISYLIANASFSTLFLSTLVAQVIAGKIDTLAHSLAFATAVISLFFFGFPSIELIQFGLFFILAALDELTLPKQYELLTKWRVFLKFGAAVFILFGRVDYFIAVMTFDIGYMLFMLLTRK